MTRQTLAAAAAQPERLSGLLDELAVAAAQGSDDALEELIWAVDKLALGRRAVHRVILNEPDVDDVTQDVLIAVAESIGSFRGEARFTTWLHQVARYKAIAHLRRQRDEAALDEELEVTDSVRISSLLAGRDRVDALLAVLPEHYRAAVALRDLDQLPYEEVAQRLDISLGTVKSRVARGRALVAARLARQAQQR